MDFQLSAARSAITETLIELFEIELYEVCARIDTAAKVGAAEVAVDAASVRFRDAHHSAASITTQSRKPEYEKST